jgi:hypothetical protein
MAQQAARLQAQVNAPRTAGVLTEGLASALTTTLTLKGASGDRAEVQSVLDQVAALPEIGVLTQTQANALLGPGNIPLLCVTRW